MRISYLTRNQEIVAIQWTNDSKEFADVGAAPHILVPKYKGSGGWDVEEGLPVPRSFLVNFPVAVIKYPNQHSLVEEGWLVKGTVCSSRDILAAGAWGTWSRGSHSQDPEGNECLCSLALSFLYSPGIKPGIGDAYLVWYLFHLNLINKILSPSSQVHFWNHAREHRLIHRWVCSWIGC